MRIVKRLFVFVCFAAACAWANAQSTPGARLVGVWHEYSPTDNLVEFGGDGSWKLYLKKSEIGDLRTLGGMWWLENDGMLNIVIVKDGQQVRTGAWLSFEGEEMILIDGSGKKTRHRRHEGPVPEVYRW